MTKLRVSVLTSVFNVEKLIGTTIESVLHQTFSDFEFLILDDESSDKSYEVCQSYAQKDNRIQLFASE
jgi:glycosyltransferase involved in cell wall biosynthesis